MKRFVLLTLLLPFITLAQHTISGTFFPVENYKWGILYKVTPTSTVYVTDARMDEKGAFALNLDEKVTPGIYRFVYGVPQEKNAFDIIYNGKEDITLAFTEDKGVRFITSEENTLWSNYQIEMKQITNEIDKKYAEPIVDKKAIEQLFFFAKNPSAKF